MPQRVMTQADFDALKTSLQARFNAGLALSPDDWKKIAGYVKSSGKSTTYAWLSQFPAFREWIGPRTHKRFSETAMQVVNRKFEATVDVLRPDWEDDDIGQYGTIAEGQGQSATDLKNDLMFQTAAAGFTTACYDGQNFFSLAHPIYPNEDGTGTPVATSNYQAGTGAPWMLLCTKRAAKSFYLQERLAPQFESQTTPTSAGVFENDVYSFGGRWRGEGVMGFWQCAFGSKADLTPANFAAAYDAMMKVKGDGNRKLGIVADLLVVGSSNRAAAEAILLKQNLANGESNVDYKRVDLLVTPWLD